MIAELAAIRNALRTALSSVSVGIGDMTGSRLPLVSVWAPPGGRPDDESVGGPDGTLADRVGITCTAARADAALKLAGDAIEALTPGRLTGSLATESRHLQLRFSTAHDVVIDRNITWPGTNTHPAYVVCFFDVDSQPI